EFTFRDGKIVTESNHNGGILGGITNGMPIEFRVVMKPTSSIKRSQKTVNLKTLDKETIVVKGRHDPCIAIRAVPVITCVSAIALYDLLIRGNINLSSREI
ncbi:chorismate synthase, partial [mine drainage metagenome]